MLSRQVFLAVLVVVAIAFALSGCSQKQEQEQGQMSGAVKKAQELANSERQDVVVIETDLGSMFFKFYEEDAPQHAANFKKLSKEGFYDGCTFHRIVPNFVIQGGDPLSKDEDRSNDGTGGPGYTVPAEIKVKHTRGSVAAARH